MSVHTVTKDQAVPCIVGKKERNYGIDLLRLVSMLYVIILHVLGKGGILDAAPVGSAQYNFSWALEMWSYCAVNIFGLISGYVGYTDSVKRHHYENYFITWLQVVFYGVSITVISYFIDPDLVTRNDLLKMFFPVTYDLYWYFTAYTGLFFVIPLLNAAVRQCDPSYLKKLFLLILILFSFYDIPLNRFEFGKGYSFVWLVLLYLLGAILKKCEIGKNISVRKAFLWISICCLVSWFWKISGKEYTILSYKFTNKLFESYVAPTHLLAAIFHLIAFSKLKMHNIAKKAIQFAAPGAFAVYLINLQFVVWRHIMDDNFAVLADRPIHTLFAYIITFSLLFVVLSVCIDFIRQKLFVLFRIKSIVNYITAKGLDAIRFLSSRIN